MNRSVPGFYSELVVPNLIKDLIVVLNRLTSITSALNDGQSIPDLMLTRCEEGVAGIRSHSKKTPVFTCIPEIQECTCLAVQLGRCKYCFEAVLMGGRVV